MRREDIVRIRRQEPCATLQNIGSRCGVTRERVRQILAKEGLPTAKITGYCRECGEPLTQKYQRYCPNKCFNIYRQRMKNILVSCSYCGNLFPRERSAINAMAARDYQHAFCNHICHAKWISKNRRSRKGIGLKHNWDLIWKLDKEGFTDKEIAERSGASKKVVGLILYTMRKRIKHSCQND